MPDNTTHTDLLIKHVGAGEPALLKLASLVIALKFQELEVIARLIDDPKQRGWIMHSYIAMWGEHAAQYGETQIAYSLFGGNGGTQTTTLPKAAAIWLHYDHPDGAPPPLPANYEAQLAEDCGEYASGLAELDALIGQHQPRNRGPHHRLGFLAAAQAGQGHGITLLRHHIAVLDGSQLGAYLVATDEHARDLCKRYGFEPLDQVLEPPSTIGFSPSRVMFPMWRDPRPPQPDSDHTGEPEWPEWRMAAPQCATGLPAPQHRPTAVTLNCLWNRTTR
ncbi:hypothetical protein [Nocardia sp. NRRL S-836]|uniref:hypothetical protein n=1 Tax=Nocardia sp. NRRL S-836 TaxID=1519492 RepID=UPI000AB1EF7E|nr:hypothetical protein [Nocardia sp. NRRL S-836]